MEDEEDEGQTKKSSKNKDDGNNYGFNDEEIDSLHAEIKIFSKEKE
jgi:hypothetical protein